MDSKKYIGDLGELSELSETELQCTLQNVFSSAKKKDGFLRLPDLNDFLYGTFPWIIYVFPNGQSSKNTTGWISLVLSACRPIFYDPDEPDFADDKREPSRLTIGLRRADGTIEDIESEIYWGHSKHNDDIEYPKFLNWTELMRRRSELLPSGSLTLTFSFQYEYYEPSTSLETLSQNFADFFTSKRGCDVTLKVKEVEFPAHKLILSARSPVFANMLKERTGLVEIEDSCTPEAFGEFLHFLYSGKIDERSKNGLDLFKLADKYELKELKPYCCVAIAHHLTVKNVLNAFKIGRQFDHIRLTLTSRDFFRKNFQEITSSIQWVEFRGDNTGVANELLEYVARTAKK